MISVENPTRTEQATKVNEPIDLKALSPPPGWSMEIMETKAVFSKFKNCYKFMEYIFEENERKEIIATLEVMEKQVKLGESFPLKKNNIYELLNIANEYTCCPGNQDTELVNMYKCQPKSSQRRKKISYYCNKLNGIFSTNCEGVIKISQKRCHHCTKYRSSLRKLRYRNNSKETAKAKTYMKVIKKNKNRLIQTEKSKNEMSGLALILKERLQDEPTGSLMAVFLRQQIQAIQRSKNGIR